MQHESRYLEIIILIIEISPFQKINAIRKFIIKIFLCHLLDFRIIQIARRGQLIFPRIIERNPLIQNIDVKITSFGQRMIQFGNTFIDKLPAKSETRRPGFPKNAPECGSGQYLPELPTAF